MYTLDSSTGETEDQIGESGIHGRHIKSTLVSRNVTILGKRTSIRLEPEMWQAIRDIAHKEGCSIHELCSLIYLRKDNNTTLTAAIRVFLMLYYRAAATPAGHDRACHGDFAMMKKRARVYGDLRTSAASLLRPNREKKDVASSSDPVSDEPVPIGHAEEAYA